MRTIDTCDPIPYSPLIPAMEAICSATPGEKLEVILNNASAFSDLKEYLSGQGIGFREIYNEETMTLQFSIPTK